MNVFSKYLLKSMKEKKGRTLLLLLSISISAALLVASMGSIKAILGTFGDQIKGNYGDYNIVITPDKKQDVPLFNPSAIKNADMKDTIKIVTIGGYLSSDNEKEFRLYGTTLTDFQKLASVKLIEQEDLEPFTGKKLIISQKTKENLKVSLGDEIKLNIFGKEHAYKIAGIASNNGMYLSDKEKTFTMITPEENVFEIYNQKDSYSIIYGAVDTKDLTGWVKDFNANNKDSKAMASKIYDEAAMESQLSTIRMPLYFMLAIVLLMTTFIIYSSFKLIIAERLPTIGVFLSQGATKGKIIRILLRESLIYGVAGGIIGDLIGVGLTKFVAYYGNPLKEYGIKATVEYYPPYFILAFFFAILLSLISTIMPILSIRKLAVKDVILNTLSSSNKVSLKSFIIGMIFVIAALVCHFAENNINYIASAPSIFLSFVGVILIIPKLTDIVFRPVVRALRNVNGLSMLSFNNVRTSKVLINNMRLIAVSIISLVIIRALSGTITNVVDGVYKGMNFDVRILVTSNYSKSIDEIVNSYSGKKEVFKTGGVLSSVNGDTAKPLVVDYVDPELFKNFEDYTVFDNKEKELDALNSNEDGIIISRMLASRYNIKQGDTIKLVTDNKSGEFKVLSIYNAKLMDGGNYNLISLKSALKHFDIKYPTLYYISTSVPAEDAKKELSVKLKGLGTTVITKAEMNKENADSNKQMTDIMGVFSYITMVIGAFGILGNVSISFIQRKREIAVISSLGLSRSGRGYMILLESIFQALIGCAISLIAAYGVNLCLTDTFKFLNMGLELKYPFEAVGVIIIASISLMLLTSLSSLVKSRKLQIVQELKYE